MRRFILGSGATVALLVVMLTFKTAATPGRSALITPAHSTPHTGTGAGATAGSSGGTHSVTGPTASTPYGPVQVRVTATGGHITRIVALQLPHDASRSQELAAYAVPILRQEALKAQSARIDVVSGATYTSQGYAQSLQGALDRMPS